MEDTWRWRIGMERSYSMRKTYEHLLFTKMGENEGHMEDFSLIWNKLAPPKVRLHAWRVIWERIPTTTKLQTRRSLPQNVGVNCIFCNEVPESVRHIDLVRVFDF
ncbi:hypothetical protein ACS0TY_029801 [Phlomoides rotata]